MDQDPSSGWDQIQDSVTRVRLSQLSESGLSAWIRVRAQSVPRSGVNLRYRSRFKSEFRLRSGPGFIVWTGLDPGSDCG